MIDREIAEYRDEILERWVEYVFGSYPEETGKFLRSKSDRFANPVGAGLREGLAELLDGVLSGAEPNELTSALDRVIRVRAVQEFTPSAAVGFVFELKDVVRDVTRDLGAEAVTVLAFDVYMSCREQMWSIRAQEIRNQSVGIMERVAEWRELREENSEKSR
jgi:hypothetical protein